MKLEMDLKCPSCGRVMKVALGEMREGRSLACPGCSGKIQIKGDGFTGAQKAVDNFERELKKMFPK